MIFLHQGNITSQNNNSPDPLDKTNEGSKIISCYVYHKGRKCGAIEPESKMLDFERYAISSGRLVVFDGTIFLHTFVHTILMFF